MYNRCIHHVDAAAYVFVVVAECDRHMSAWLFPKPHGRAAGGKYCQRQTNQEDYICSSTLLKWRTTHASAPSTHVAYCGWLRFRVFCSARTRRSVQWCRWILIKAVGWLHVWAERENSCCVWDCERAFCACAWVFVRIRHTLVFGGSRVCFVRRATASRILWVLHNGCGIQIR